MSAALLKPNYVQSRITTTYGTFNFMVAADSEQLKQDWAQLFMQLHHAEARMRKMEATIAGMRHDEADYQECILHQDEVLEQVLTLLELVGEH